MSEHVSPYKGWLRNVYVRRAYILFIVPIVLPVKLLPYIWNAIVKEAIPELVSAWKDDSRQPQ